MVESRGAAQTVPAGRHSALCEPPLRLDGEGGARADAPTADSLVGEEEVVDPVVRDPEEGLAVAVHLPYVGRL